jgi:hypothetical protein
MNSNAPADPAVFLSGRERRAWRRAERRALRDHDAQQLTTLRTLAATGGALTGLLYRDSGGHAAPAEFIIAGKRIRAGGVHRPVLRALTQAIAASPAVPLLGASRYRPYWVLTFELPAAPLAVLVDVLTILPDRHNGSPWPAAPTPPTGGRRRPAPSPSPGYGADVAFELAESNDAVRIALESVRPGGRVVLGGIPDSDATTFRASLARRKGLTIAMVRRMNEVYPRAIDLAAGGVVALDPLVSSRTPLTDAAQAFAAAEGRAGLKAIIAP